MSMLNTSDFTQLATDFNGLSKMIDKSVTLARKRGINVDSLDRSHNKTKSDIKEAFGRRLEAGGKHSVTEGEDALLRRFRKDMTTGIFYKLTHLFTAYHFYKQHRDAFQAWAAKVHTLPTKVKLADGVVSQTLYEDSIRYAEEGRATAMADSRRALDEMLEAINDGNQPRACRLMRTASNFTSREDELHDLLKCDVLVEVKE
jgi:hypothetical protein